MKSRAATALDRCSPRNAAHPAKPDAFGSKHAVGVDAQQRDAKSSRAPPNAAFVCIGILSVICA